MVPLRIRKAKHAVFGFLPGWIGLRNRACLHHLTKPPMDAEFERALTKVKPGDICIDCGANVGAFTRQMAKTGATVYAFEPDPWSFKKLSEEVSEISNVVLINKAVGVATSEITFYRNANFEQNPERYSLGSSFYPRENSEAITVEVVDFIKFAKSLGRPIAVLKMDIEGAEVEILEQLLSKEKLHLFGEIFVETHEVQFPELLERTWDLRARIKTIDGAKINLDWH